MLNHNYSAGYKGHNFTLQDGLSEITSFGEGSKVMQIQTSQLPLHFNQAEALQNHHTTMAQQSAQQGYNLSHSASQNLSSALRDTMDLSQRLSHSEHWQQGYSHSINAEQTKGLSQVSHLTQDFAKSQGIDERKAADILASAAVGLSLGKNSLSVGGSSHLSAAETAHYSAAQRVVSSKDFQDSLRQAVVDCQSLSQNLSDESSQILAQNIGKSYDLSEQQRQEASHSFSQSDSWSQQASLTKGNSATINANQSQRFMEWLANQPAEHRHSPMGYQGAAHIIAHDPAQAFAYGQKFMAANGYPEVTAAQGQNYHPQNYYPHTPLGQPSSAPFAPVNPTISPPPANIESDRSSNDVRSNNISSNDVRSGDGGGRENNFNPPSLNLSRQVQDNLAKTTASITKEQHHAATLPPLPSVESFANLPKEIAQQQQQGIHSRLVNNSLKEIHKTVQQTKEILSHLTKPNLDKANNPDNKE